MNLGVYQCIAAGRSAAKRLNVLESKIADRGLDLVVCPELFMGGYNPALDYNALAETTDGPFAQGIADIARRHNLAIAYGYPERGDGVVYNSAALIGPDGVLLTNHRKRLPSPGSFEEVTFANGPVVSFAELRGWRIAIVICYEVEFPESIRQAAQGGAQLVLVPTALGADWGVVSERVVLARAFENGVWMAYADHAGQDGDSAFFGGSRIVDPMGQDMAVAGQEETLLTAELSRDSVECAQNRLPYLRDCLKL